METHEQRQAAYLVEVRAKYTPSEVDALGAKGHAFKDPDDGHYSYPIDDLEDLRNAVHAVGRGNASHDAIRKYIIHMAGVLSATDEIPDNWNADGSLAEAKAAAGMKTCPTCEGSGTIMEGNRKCPTCGGTGEVAAETKARARRPSAETRAARDDMRGVRETRRVPVSDFEIREVPNGTGGTNLRFTGYASVTCADHDDLSHAYEMEDWVGPYNESIVRGAFVKTLKEGADVAFLVNHGGVAMARTKAGSLKLAEDLTGLNVDATLNPKRADVQILHAAVQDGALDEMSFGFRVTRQEWNGAYDQRWITEVNLDKGDVSPVNYGANPHTGGMVSMRSAVALLSGRGLTAQSWVDAITELRLGKTISQATYDALAPIHQHLTQGADLATDLGALLGMDASASADEDDDSTPTRAYAAEDFPYGLRCSDCSTLFRDGDRIVERADDGGIVTPVCSMCAHPPAEPVAPMVFLPDYTTHARARLAALRG